MNKSEMLRALARKNGMCDKWYKEWGDCSDEELVKKFLDGMNFCIKSNFPNVNIIKSFDNKLLNRNNIYVDEESLNLHNPSKKSPHKVVLCGNTNATIFYDCYSVADLYIQHDCKVNLICINHAIVHVTITGNASVCIIKSENASVSVYKKNATCKVVSDKGVVVNTKK